LRKRVQDAASELEGSSLPFVGPETPRMMREAAELMGKALGKLRGLQLQEAQSAQEAAAEQFAQLQRKAQQSRQPRDGAESGAAGPRERIEIPGADSFHPPREFRQDIMDAMKERPPSVYRSQVKRYYEELVR
jgi:Sec-independent protein translocase protein TatA